MSLYRIEHRMGFGDAVALTAVLRHLRHYVPGCRIELIVSPGRERLYTDLADQVETRSDPRRPPTHVINWPLPTGCYSGAPFTYVEKCLLETFRLQPITDLCRYQVRVNEADRRTIRARLNSLRTRHSAHRPLALCHFRGVALRERKDLDDCRAAQVVAALEQEGYRVLLWEENARTELPEQQIGERLNPAIVHRIDAQGQSGMCAGLMAALLAEVDLFVGVDSGPLHLATAVGAPAIGLWTRQSPVHCICHDDTTVHLLLIPQDHPNKDNPREIERFFVWRRGNSGAIAFFKDRYRHLWCETFGQGISEALFQLQTKYETSHG